MIAKTNTADRIQVEWIAISVAAVWLSVLPAAAQEKAPAIAKTLQTIKVQATADGSEAAGYKTEEISRVGMWEGRTLLDTPYAISVMPEELLKNLQANSADQIFKVNPVTQFHWPQAQNDNPYVFLRGFQTTTFARNGITRQKWNYAHGTVMEEVAQVEVLTGLSGFLYGAGNLGGVVNFVTKKPTRERLNSVTLGNAGGSNYYVHGDFGGQLNEAETLGYRINLVAQDGETAISQQHNKREFASAAFNWRVTDNLVLEIDGSKRDYYLDGRQAYWYLASGVKRPEAEKLDPSKVWAQPWAMQDMDSERLGANMRWQPNAWLGLRAGYLDESNSRTGTTASNTIQSNNTYNQRITTNRDAPQKIMGTGSYGFVDIHFTTGTVTHKTTAGYQISKSIWDIYVFPDNSVSVDFNGLPLNTPAYFPEPDWQPHGTKPVTPAYNHRTHTISIGDDIQFNERWSALVGLSDNQIEVDAYQKSAVTPTVSAIYKPRDNISTYASYMEGLEQGGQAAQKFEENFDVVNAGEIFEPLISKQLEAGIKTSVADMLLTAALFNIDKPLEYYRILNEKDAEFVQDGRQVHQGLELTATGKITPDLTLMGGLTWLDAEVKENEQFPEYEGKRPVAVAEEMVKAYVEYQIRAVPGLSLNGGWSYTGNFYGDQLNTDKMPGYMLVDAGARYFTEVANNALTLRLNINNLTDEHYWANQYFLGDPRAILFSVNLTL